jgi:lysophospholipase L1-like esterase
VKIKRELIVIVLCYLICLHVVLGIIVLKTDLLHMISYKFGFGSTPLELSDFYNKLVTHQLRLDKNVPKKSIIYFGDSLIQELCVNAISTNGINYGIGGDTTYGLLRRIQKYQSIADARAIIIAIGMNDIQYRLEKDIVNNYKKILSYLPDNIPIIINAILPVDEPTSKKRINAVIRGINAELRKLSATSLQKIYFVDSTTKLADSNGNLSFYVHAGDGVHLNECGNRIWIQDLKQILALVLSPTSAE